MRHILFLTVCLTILGLVSGCGSKQEKETRNQLPGIWSIEKDASRTMIYNSEMWKQMGPNQKEVMDQGMELFLSSVQIEFTRTNMSFIRGETRRSTPYNVLNAESNAAMLEVYFDGNTSSVSIVFRAEDLIEFSAGQRLAFPVVLERTGK